VASGLIFVASSMFQAMGNTVPSLIASGVRIALITVLAVVFARMPGFQLNWIWYLSVCSVLVQLTLSMLLLRREFDRRLRWEPSPTTPESSDRAVAILDRVDAGPGSRGPPARAAIDARRPAGPKRRE
jgi:hypothetical protein